MTVRFRLALTIFATGAATALGVIIAVVLAFQRFEHERTYDRGNAFLGRVLERHDDMLELHTRDPAQFTAWLRALLLFEPDTQLYLLDASGTVLTSTGEAALPPGFKVTLAPVQQAVAAAQGRMRAPYVMGDDPEHMQADAVISARALRRAVIRPSAAVDGYLYLVSQRGLPQAGRLELFRSSLAGPALASVLAVIVVTTLLALWIVATVTMPLRRLSDAVAAASRDGFNAMPPVPDADATKRLRRDEFGQLQQGFQAMLVTLSQQWNALRNLDRFRRESVSNLSHDLRSPLTATVACLETLEQRWAGDQARAADRQLTSVALRNARNAAQLVRALGDLALLDEPEFKLHPMRMDLAEVLDDIQLRFADRAQAQGVALAAELPSGETLAVSVDIELFERALANLVDNALKFTPAGGRITLSAQADAGQVQVSVSDTGAGIAEHDLPHLFERLYQADPARAEGSKGLGLAIVRRIVELHNGEIEVHSERGQGSRLTIALPRA